MSPPPKYNPDEDVNRAHWSTLARLLKFLWPKGRYNIRMRVVLALLCLVGAKLANALTPYVYKLIVDALDPKEPMIAMPLGLVIGYGIARLSISAFGELRDLVFIPVSQQAKRRLALMTFAHLHRLSLRFHLDRQTGGLSRVIERALRAMQFVMSFMLFNIIPTIIELMLVAGIMYWNFDLRYALIILGSVVFYVTATMTITEWRLKYRKKMNAEDSKANTRAIDSLINYETVKYFNNEEHEYERYDRSLAGYEKAAVKNQSSLGFLNFSQASIISVAVVSIMYLAAAGVVSGEISIGDFVMANTYMMQLFIPLGFLGFVYREMKQSFIDMDKMFELIEVNPEIQDAPDAKDIQISGARVEFHDVNFSYDGERQILRNVEFVVEPGQTTAIVGPSGSGKSTISRLLFRFYDPQSGKITIDGQDLREITGKSLRANIGMVPQDTVLFNDTIHYNLEYGRPGADDKTVHEAAQLAELDTFISKLPDGYETSVGERGLKLSGGEKQRVAIARALLKAPRIMIFDEATSALDSKTEQDIQTSLDRIAENRTTIVIAHRLSTIKNADQILVLSEGKIVERGRHDELIAKGGEYSSMWQRQQQQNQLEAQLAECK